MKGTNEIDNSHVTFTTRTKITTVTTNGAPSDEWTTDSPNYHTMTNGIRNAIKVAISRATNRWYNYGVVPAANKSTFAGKKRSQNV